MNQARSKTREYQRTYKRVKKILENVGFYIKGAGRSMLEETIIKKAGGLRSKYFKRVPKYGERAWLVPGIKKDIIVWDNGNGWYQILKK